VADGSHTRIRYHFRGNAAGSTLRPLPHPVSCSQASRPPTSAPS
jgi:hypothetical protein